MTAETAKRTMSFKEQLDDVIHKAVAECATEEQQRKEFTDAWMAAQRVLLPLFSQVQVSLAESGMIGEAGRHNGGIYLFWASHEIRVEFTYGISVVWTERHGNNWEVPEKLCPEPLRLKYWEFRLLDFAGKAARLGP